MASDVDMADAQVQQPVPVLVRQEVDQAITEVDGQSPATFIPFDVIKEVTRGFSAELFVGLGNFGIVYQATMMLGGDEQRKVAVKVLKNAPQTRRDAIGEMKEVQISGGLQPHRNVVSYLGFSRVREPVAVRLPNGKEVTIGKHALCIVSDFVDGTTLERWLRKAAEDPYGGPHPPLRWEDRVGILFDIASGLAHLHAPTEKHPNGVVHCDLRSENVIVREKAGFEAVITDFGLSAHIEDDGTYVPRYRKSLGALGCADPEILKTGSYTLACDVYGFGMIVLELVTGVKGYVEGRPQPEAPLNLLKKHVNRSDCAQRMSDKHAPVPRNPNAAKAATEDLLTLATTCVLQQERPAASHIRNMVQGIARKMGLELEDDALYSISCQTPREDSLVLPVSNRSLNPNIIKTPPTRRVPSPSSSRTTTPEPKHATTFSPIRAFFSKLFSSPTK